jgi:hypothetical protein
MIKHKSRVVLASLLIGLIPWPMPWQIGGAIDNAIYQAVWGLAFYIWQPHATMMAISHVFTKLSDALTSNVLPLMSEFIINYVQETNIYVMALTLAIMLGGLSLVFSFVDLRIVDFGKMLQYTVIVLLVFTYGGSAMQAVETLREDIATGLYEGVYSTVEDGGVFGDAFQAPAPTDPWAEFNTGGASPRSVYDTALIALEASAMEALVPGLPSGFESRYFPHASIGDLNSGRRSDAIQAGWQGVIRLWLSYPLSIVSVIESLMEVLFSIAGMILLTAMPLALVFGFFRPTEAIISRLMQQYIMFAVNYLVIAMLTSIGVSGLITATATRSLTMLAAGAFLSAIFYWIGLKAAWGAMKSSFTAFTGSVAQALDVEEPMGAAVDTVKGGVGAAVGLAGAGAALAAGMPHLAPAALKAGQSFTDLSEEEQQAERRKGRVRAGLGVLGGMAMQGTPLQGPATAYSAMRTFGGSEGMDEMLGGLTGADAAMVGLSSRSPFGAVYALDRARRRRERLERKYQGGRSGDRSRGGGEGWADDPDARQGTVPDGTGITMDTFTDSPWEREVQQAMVQFGDQWAQEVAQAVREVAADLRAQGMDEETIAAHFVNQDGDPSFDSGRGRDVFNDLSPEVQRLLAKETGALRGARGVIGEEVMPERSITRQEMADAVAYAVDNAGNESGAGARAVAEALGTKVEQLGNHFGGYNSMISTAQKQGYTGSQVKQQILDPSGDYVDDNMKSLTRFVPAETTYKQSKL